MTHILLVVSPTSLPTVATALTSSLSFHHFGLFPLFASSCQQSAFLWPDLPHLSHFPANFLSFTLFPTLPPVFPFPFFQCLPKSAPLVGILHFLRNSASFVRSRGMSSSHAWSVV